MGVLLFDVSVQIEILNYRFSPAKIKQKLRESVIITPLQCVTDIHYVQPSSQFARMMLGAYLCQGSFAPDMAIETTIRGSFCRLIFPKEGGGLGKLMNESSLRCMDNEILSPRSSGVSSSESDKTSIGHKIRPLFCVTSILVTSSTDSRFPSFQGALNYARPLFCVTSILATSSTDSRFPSFQGALNYARFRFIP